MIAYIIRHWSSTCAVYFGSPSPAWTCGSRRRWVIDLCLPSGRRSGRNQVRKEISWVMCVALPLVFKYSMLAYSTRCGNAAVIMGWDLLRQQQTIRTLNSEV